MPSLGVNVAVIHHGQVLLTRREDYEMWCLPGGRVEMHETVAQAATREVREETGIDVTLTRMVGIYSRPHWRFGAHVMLFAARPVGGRLRPQPGETLEVDYFDPSALPTDTIWWHVTRIADALGGVQGVVRQQSGEWPWAADISQRDIKKMREQSGLTRQAFFTKYMNDRNPTDDLVEVAGKVVASERIL